MELPAPPATLLTAAKVDDGAAAAATRSSGAIANTSFHVPAAAHTSSYCSRSGSMNTGSGVAWPNGGTPPIGKPVAARTASASTRVHVAPPAAAAELVLVELVGAADVGQHDVAVDGEDQALDDLADVDTDRRRRVGCGLRAVGEVERLDRRGAAHGRPRRHGRRWDEG